MKRGTINVFACILIILFVIIGGCISKETKNKNISEKNQPPSILNFEVHRGWPTGYDIQWNVTDEDSDNLTVTFYYSYDNKITWEEILNTSLIDNLILWDFPDTGKEEKFVIKLVVSDGDLETDQISQELTAIPLIKHYKYTIEIIPKNSDWNILYLPAIKLDNNSLSEIIGKLDPENFEILKTHYGQALKINTSKEITLSGELSLTTLNSEYKSDHSFTMYNLNQSDNPIDTSEFPKEFIDYNLQIGCAWLYYNNSEGLGNITVKIKFDFNSFGAIYQAVWGEISVGWQKKEVYECEYVV